MQVKQTYLGKTLRTCVLARQLEVVMRVPAVGGHLSSPPPPCCAHGVLLRRTAARARHAATRQAVAYQKPLKLFSSNLLQKMLLLGCGGARAPRGEWQQLPAGTTLDRRREQQRGRASGHVRRIGSHGPVVVRHGSRQLCEGRASVPLEVCRSARDGICGPGPPRAADTRPIATGSDALLQPAEQSVDAAAGSAGAHNELD